MTAVLKRLEKAGTWIEDMVLVIILSGMILLATGQIIGRNLFGTSLAHSDELLRILVLWLTLAGAVAASRADRHISIAVLDKFLPERMASLSLVITHGFTAGICGIIAWHSLRFVLSTYEYGDTILGGVPAWPVQAVMPLGFLLMAYRHVLLALKNAAALLAGKAKP